MGADAAYISVYIKRDANPGCGDRFLLGGGVDHRYWSIAEEVEGHADRHVVEREALERLGLGVEDLHALGGPLALHLDHWQLAGGQGQQRCGEYVISEVAVEG